MQKEIKVIELHPNVYQIELGKKAIVLKAKSLSEAFKRASKYLGIKCDKSTLKAVK